MATFKTYSILIKTQSGDTFTFNGAEGAKVHRQLEKKETISATAEVEGGTTMSVIIPFWSVDNAKIAVQSEEKSMSDNACTEK